MSQYTFFKFNNRYRSVFMNLTRYATITKKEPLKEIEITPEEDTVDVTLFEASLEGVSSKLSATYNATITTLDKIINSNSDLTESIIKGVEARRLVVVKWSKLNKQVTVPEESFSGYVQSILDNTTKLNEYLDKISRGQTKSISDDLKSFIDNGLSEEIDALDKWKKVSLIDLPIDGTLDDLQKSTLLMNKYIVLLRSFSKKISTIQKLDNTELTEGVPVTVFLTVMKSTLKKLNTLFRKEAHHAISIINRMVADPH